MIAMTSISELLPHSGDMVLIDEVQSWSQEEIVCTSSTHLLSSNPLRTAKGLSINAALEYGSQTIAIHGALKRESSSKPKQALIVAVKQANWTIDYLDQTPLPLIILAKVETQLSSLAQYCFEIKTEADPQPLYTATISVTLR